MSLRLTGQFLLAGAIGAMLASLLIFVLPGPAGIDGPGSIPTNVVAILSGLLLLVGLPALYRAQATQMGRLGWIGVALLWVATVLLLLVLTGVQILDVAARGSIPHLGHGPPLAAVIPALLGVFLLLIGGVIVGIKTIQAQRFAAAIGWLLISSPVLLLLTAPVATNQVPGIILNNLFLIVFYAGLAWAGATLSFQGVPMRVAAPEGQRS
jgi:hypothetical protein